MAAIPIELRDELITGFRERVSEKCVGVMGWEGVPLEHQAAWWAAADGQILLPNAPPDGDPTIASRRVRLPDKSVARRAIVDRPHGRARVVAELAAFKGGKSSGMAMWATGFAAVPGAKVPLIGLEYDMCVPEFEYLAEFLCSERGMNLPFESYQNRPKDGRMWLELKNGARYEARSWDRKDTLKGKEWDALLACEAYQFPGIEVFTSVKQNLEARDGYFVATTTADRPWVAVFHERGHGDPTFPEWQCFCGIPRRVNPYSYKPKTEAQDRELMTREKYAVAHEGLIGEYIGSVYAYQRGQRQITPESHGDLLLNADLPVTRENLRIPPNWRREVGFDTGTYLGALVMAFDPEGACYVLEEVPNYRYIVGEIELETRLSIAGWATKVKQAAAMWGARPVGWCDTNTQFDQELTHHGIILIGNPVGLEARTETTRSYFQHGQIWLAPWLQVLPYELEQQRWPEDVSATGRYQRLKKKDHLVDPLEHCCSRHPRGREAPKRTAPSWKQRYNLGTSRKSFSPHLGRH